MKKGKIHTKMQNMHKQFVLENSAKLDENHWKCTIWILLICAAPFLLLRVNILIIYLSVLFAIYLSVLLSDRLRSVKFHIPCSFAIPQWQPLAVITPSQPTGMEQFLWNAPAGSSVGKGSHLGHMSWLLLSATPTSAALRLSTTASSV